LNVLTAAKFVSAQALGMITKVILAHQVLEVAISGQQVGLVRVDKPIAYLDIDDTGLVAEG
jgi:hypothetical protein